MKMLANSIIFIWSFLHLTLGIAEDIMEKSVIREGEN